jgi:hypothetical protein
MTKNNKPILSILIDEDKRVKFADLAKRNNLSMSYLVNQAIDRMLETDSIDIHRDSIVSSVGNYVDSSVGGMTRTDIEESIKLSIVSMDIERLVKSYVDGHNFSVVSTDDVKQLIAASANELLELIPSDIPTLETIKAEINLSIAPIENSIVELETYTQSQFKALRDELRAISNRSVEVPAARIVSTPTRPRKENPKADSLPDWVTKDARRFYSLLVDNSDLLDKVSEAIGLSANNTELADSLFELGIHKQDGTALDTSSMSRIKYVVSHLKTTPESTLPLFSTND